MKNKLIILISVMIIMVVAVFAIISNKKESEIDDGNIRIVTSFYPVYVLTINLTDQISDIEVDSLTDFSSGCLHDYQLTTNDMRLLSNADVFIINGGGMEEYLEDVISNYPHLTIINLSKNIPMIESLEHEGEHNPHVWLDPELYMKQIENARDGLIEYINNLASESISSDIAEKINSNASNYLKKVGDIADDMNGLINIARDMSEKDNISIKVVVFHDSISYFANKAGLEVAFSLEIHDDTPLSAGKIAEVIDLINKENIRYLFTEHLHDDTISDRIKEETNAGVYKIDTAVTGEVDKDSYLRAMRNNIETLSRAFEDND